jgi:hypothetical protein
VSSYSALPITVSTPEFPGNVKLFGPDEGRNSATVNAGAAIQWTPQIATYMATKGNWDGTITLPMQSQEASAFHFN